MGMEQTSEHRVLFVPEGRVSTFDKPIIVSKENMTNVSFLH